VTRTEPTLVSAETRAGSQVRLGVIGLGRMGSIHSENVASVAGLRLIAVSDPYAPALDAAASRLGVSGYADWGDLVDRRDIDAVLISSPSAFHCDQIIAAAVAGKHVLCEKPIDLDLERIDEALRAVERAGVMLQVGFNRRWDRNFAGLARRIAEGAVGEPWMVRITSRDPAPPSEDYVRASGGLFADMAIHDFDLARFLTGDEIVEVSTFGAALVNPALERIPDVDCAVTTLRFASGALGVIENCRQSAVGWDQRAEVHGALGTVSAENEQADTVVQANASGVHRARIAGFLADRYGGAYREELCGFAESLLTGAPPVASAEDGRASAIVAAAAQLSYDERRPVAIAEIAR
jgi:myo-inositol 2-dehydrogenase/D-chiro-inositol 1-dehydrogenase